MTTHPIPIERLLGLSADGIFAIDRERRFVLFNGACERITGARSADVVDQQCRCSDVLECRDAQSRSLSGSLCPTRGLFDGRDDAAQQRLWIRRADGARVWIETNYAVLRDERGEVELVLGVMRDATEAKAREDELREELASLRGQVRRSGTEPHTTGAAHGVQSPSPATESPGGAVPAGGTDEAEAPHLLDPVLMRVEREAIRRALRAAGWQRNAAAELMGISRSRLYRRMEALGIDPDDHS